MSCWLLDDNREKHLIGGFILGLTLTFLCAIGCAGGMEFKDKQWGGKWDWLDFAATCIGGTVGQVLQALIVYLIFFV